MKGTEKFGSFPIQEWAIIIVSKGGTSLASNDPKIHPRNLFDWTRSTQGSRPRASTYANAVAYKAQPPDFFYCWKFALVYFNELLSPAHAFPHLLQDGRVRFLSVNTVVNSQISRQRIVLGGKEVVVAIVMDVNWWFVRKRASAFS